MVVLALDASAAVAVSLVGDNGARLASWQTEIRYGIGEVDRIQYIRASHANVQFLEQFIIDGHGGWGGSGLLNRTSASAGVPW